MLRGSKATKQQHKSSTKSKTPKVSKPLRKLHTKKSLAPLTSTLNKNKKNKFSPMTSTQSNFSTESAPATEAPKAKKPSHEAGFDVVISRLKELVASDEVEGSELLRQQHRAIAGFETRPWEVRDTLTILPHFLEMIQPDSPFVRVAVHKMANLRANLKEGEEKRIKETAKTTINGEENDEHELKRKLMLNETTVDLIPVPDILRLQMQILFASAQFSHLSYQNYTRKTFNMDQNGAQVFSSILDHLETVPQLTFYRMHYQQALLNLTSALVNRPAAQLVDIMTTIDDDSLQGLFLKRFAFSRSTAFKEAIKDEFKRQDVLADTTMLPLNDPTNITKSNIVTDVTIRANNGITAQVGIKGDALGHLLVETELAMGVRFPRKPKHILNVKTQYNMTKISKMPQNPMIMADYSKILNELVLPEEKRKAILSSVKNGADAAANAREQDMALEQEKIDSVNFISEISELPVHYPEDLWSVPVDRDQRGVYFKRFPAAHVLWTVYNQLINTTTTLDNDMEMVERYNQHVLILEKSHLDVHDEKEKEALDAKIMTRRHQITVLQDKIEQNRHLLEALTSEYETKAEPWRAQMDAMNKAAEEEEAAEKKE